MNTLGNHFNSSVSQLSYKQYPCFGCSCTPFYYCTFLLQFHKFDIIFLKQFGTKTACRKSVIKMVIFINKNKRKDK